MPPPAEPLKVLVVDDIRSNVLLLGAILAKGGHTTITAHDGLQAISAFLHEEPDLILMDVQMPNLDGIAAAREIRDMNPVIPIIFLSASDDRQTVNEGLEIGSDYIAKPIDVEQLHHKLDAHFRTIQAHRVLSAKNREIGALHDALRDENAMAGYALSKMLAKTQPSGNGLEYTVLPAGAISGDIVLAGMTPSGRLNVLLADAIGHGLPAAFSLMPVITVFDAMTRKGFPLDEILFEIDKAVRNTLPVGRFVAATAVSLDYAACACDIWVGGNPPVVIASAGAVRHIPSDHLALGLNDGTERGEFTCRRVQLRPGDRLVFSSDGLTEAWAEQIQPDAGTLDDFIAHCAPERIFEYLTELATQAKRHDDTSLVVIHADPARVAHAPPRPLPVAAQGRIDIELGVSQLKNAATHHDIVDAAEKLGLITPGDPLFRMVFAELFANALDHGVLGLSSETKYQDASGMERYAASRAAHLAAVKHGRIRIEIEATHFAGEPATRLRLLDSGAGFDQSVAIAHGDFSHTATAGRGLTLVRSACLGLIYAGTGNDVTAYVSRRTAIEGKLKEEKALPLAA